MPLCPHRHRPATERDGYSHSRRQRYACRRCRRDFTAASTSAFAGYRWPAEVIVMAVPWYLGPPLSARQVTWLLAERGIDVTPRTVLTWTQTFGPRLAAEVRKHRRRVGGRWYVDEVFLCRRSEQRYLYCAVDERGQVADVLLREHRDTASAKAFFRRALQRARTTPAHVITDHHQPYRKAVQEAVPEAVPTAIHVRTGLHRARGETTKPIERSPIATRDRLRASRGSERVRTGQRFLEGFEALQALRGGRIALQALVPGHPPTGASPHERDGAGRGGGAADPEHPLDRARPNPLTSRVARACPADLPRHPVRVWSDRMARR
jgi:transposase-like protein